MRETTVAKLTIAGMAAVLAFFLWMAIVGAMSRHTRATITDCGTGRVFETTDWYSPGWFAIRFIDADTGKHVEIHGGYILETENAG